MLSTALKTARVNAELTQAELAKLIGLSRETIIAIENNYDKTIENLSLFVISKWIKACGNKVAESTLLSIKSELLKATGF